MNVPKLEEINANPKIFCAPMFLKSKYPEFAEYLKNTYPGKKITEGMYCYFHGTAPTCPVCGKPTKFINWGMGFHGFCSRRCTSIGTRQQAQQTMMRLYGAKNSFERPGFHETSKQTMMKRYGVEYAQQSKEIYAKSTATIRARYGVDRPTQDPTIKEKALKTTHERYGGIGMGSEVIRSKTTKTNIARYGYDIPSKNKSIVQKIIGTHESRYGGIGHSSPAIKEKILSTIQNRYGVDNVSKSGILRGLDTIYISDDIIRYDGPDWVCRCPHPECDKCSEKTYTVRRQVYADRKRLGCEPCTRLCPVGAFTSSLEQFIIAILEKHGIKYMHRDRVTIGKELDIYIPSARLAIECNGIYWHSTRQQANSHTHIDKFKLCRQHDIQLLTIWEDWVHNTPEIVESMILSKLGIFQRRIGASKCKIKYVKSCSGFMRNNHIQGPSKSSVHICLTYRDEVVAAMEFAKRTKVSGGKNDDSWELTRFCTAKNTQVIAAASRLLNRFIKDYAPHKIVSFSSNDISNGAVYKSLGFESSDEITSAYWYITPSFKRYHRTNFMKSRLVAMGEDPTKTEFEIMSTKPIFRVYDSGHIKHTLNL